MIENTQEIELSDEQLENISGGLCVHPVGGGLGGVFGGHWGGGFGGFYGGPVFVGQPQVLLVPVQTVVEPVPVTAVTGVQATGCQQGVTLALV